jgi:hypothetical protein
MSRYVLLRIYAKGEATKHTTVWPYPRWKDWRERHKDKYADIDERFVVKKGTKRECVELQKVFDRLTKD